MSYDFAVWKRSATTRTAMLAEAYEAICDGSGHPAVDVFDSAELGRALARRYEHRGGGELPFIVDADARDGSSWLIVNCPFVQANEIRDELLPLALERGLMVYDPQRQVVWGNKRPRA